MIFLKQCLTWYLNRYSNGWNQHCDICWAGYIAAVHFLYGFMPGILGFLLFSATQLIKVFVPTDYDKENTW